MKVARPTGVAKACETNVLVDPTRKNPSFDNKGLSRRMSNPANRPSDECKTAATLAEVNGGTTSGQHSSAPTKNDTTLEDRDATSHARSAIKKAARWYAGLPTDERRTAGVPDLKQRFGLTAKQACQALRLARELRTAGAS